MPQRSPLQILGRIPIASLKSFFQDHLGVLQHINFDELKEDQVEPIFEAMRKLPDSTQARIEGGLRLVDAMACSAGALALADEATFHQDHEFIEELSNIEGYHAKAMWAALTKREYWRGASYFLRSDSLPDKAWKKRTNLPKRMADVSETAKRNLELAIGAYFSKREGRGRNCKIDIYRRHRKEYFCAQSEDFAQSDPEWVDGGLSRRPRRPAFEIIFVYCRAEGSLDIYAPGNPKAVPELQRLFAKAILKLHALEEQCPLQQVYDLSPLACRDFVFKYDRSMGIKDVRIRRLRLAFDSGRKKVILEVDPSLGPHSIHDLLESLPLPPYRVTQTGIDVCFAETAARREHTRSFDISHPDYCALRHEGDDLTIRQMLIDSSIEPHARFDQDEEAA